MISVWLLLALAFGLVAAAIGVLLVGGHRAGRREGRPADAARRLETRDADRPGDDDAAS